MDQVVVLHSIKVDYCVNSSLAKPKQCAQDWREKLRLVVSCGTPDVEIMDLSPRPEKNVWLVINY